MTEHKQAAAASQGEGQIKRSLETRHLTMIALGGVNRNRALYRKWFGNFDCRAWWFAGCLLYHGNHGLFLDD